MMIRSCANRGRLNNPVLSDYILRYMKGGETMEWRTIIEAPFYQVSDTGIIRSLDREVKTFNGNAWYYRRVKGIPKLKTKDIRGYQNVSLIQYDENMRPIRRYTRQVHRLVLEQFKPIDNMKDLQVNHIDGVKSNNNLFNLEWVTPKENAWHGRHILHHYREQYGELNNMSKLTTEQVIQIIHECNKIPRLSDTKIAQRYNVDRKTISHIRRGMTWKHISRNI